MALLMYKQGFRWWNMGYAAADRVRALRRDPRRDARPVPQLRAGETRRRGDEAARGGSSWSTRLLVAGAALTLRPLVWMISASLMPTGEASSFPPVLFPSRSDARATTATLFTRLTWPPFAQQRCSSRSPSPAARCCSTRWRATRSRSCASPGATGSSRFLLAALVIPGQVAMLPLFLLMRSSRPRQHATPASILPGIAGIFGIFLDPAVRALDPGRAARRGAAGRRGRVADLLDDRPAAPPARPGHARRLHVSRDAGTTSSGRSSS